ncbi:MAG: hypothetical protein WC648_05325 [Candidatus Paceibacterota bacterium]|jgi:hypothetical protein
MKKSADRQQALKKRKIENLLSGWVGFGISIPSVMKLSFLIVAVDLEDMELENTVQRKILISPPGKGLAGVGRR